MAICSWRALRGSSTSPHSDRRGPPHVYDFPTPLRGVQPHLQGSMVQSGESASGRKPHGFKGSLRETKSGWWRRPTGTLSWRRRAACHLRDASRDRDDRRRAVGEKTDCFQEVRVTSLYAGRSRYMATPAIAADAGMTTRRRYDSRPPQRQPTAASAPPMTVS